MHDSLVTKAALKQLVLLIAATAAASQGLAQSVLPASLIGSYDLTMQATNTASPIPDGTGPLRIEISAEGLLCTDGVPFGSSSLQNNFPQRIFWTSALADLEFSVSTSGNFAGISLGSASGTAYGTLVGAKVSDIPETCGQRALHNTFFALAETLYPTLFPASVFVFTQQNEVSDFRYYPSTNLYLAVEDGGQVIVSGGEFDTGRPLGYVDTIVAAGAFELGGGEAEQPADPYYVGTYSLALTETAPFSPIPPGTPLTFVLLPDFTLCVGETVLSPTFGQGVFGGVTWYNPEARYFYELDIIPVEERLTRAGEGAFHFFNANGLPYGKFAGDRTALSTECPDAQGINPDLPEIDLLLSLAEQSYPELFPGGPQTFNQRLNGSVYRFYRSSGITVRVSDRQVFANGGRFGEESHLGSLEALINNLRSRTLPIAVPASLTGTFSMTFTSAGPYVQIPDQSGMDLSIDQNGRLCLDGVVLMNPYLSPANQSIIRWENPAGGFRLELDTSAAAPPALALAMTSSQGLRLGTLAGSKSLLFPTCSGLLGNGVNLAAAQQLIELGEQYLSEQFPPSALTYNRFEGNKLLRYYPATGVMLALENDSVELSGGAFGALPRTFGSVQQLTAQLRERFNLAQLRNVSLNVAGTLRTTLSNSPSVTRAIEISHTQTSAPANTDSDTLARVVEQVLGNEISGRSTYTFTIVADNADELIFDVLISNEITVSLTRVRRDYDLRFRYARQ